MQKITFFSLTVLLLSALAPLGAQNLVGNWKTIDDETNEAKSHVEIYQSPDGKFQGKVVKMLKSSPDRLCDKCPGERHNQPILGMLVVENLSAKGGHLQDGKILDPEKGKWYTCKMWLKDGDPNVMVVRGYIGPFYRTQYWYRV